MEYLILSRWRGGIVVKDTITGNKTNFIGLDEKQAINSHRYRNNLQRKHFTVIYV